jgi:hypothetical protein
MRHTTFAAALFAAVLAVQAEQVDLIGVAPWSGGVDRGGTTMAVAPTPEARLAVSIGTDGGPECYPKLRRSWDTATDLSSFSRLRCRLRVTSTDPTVRSQTLAFVFYDAKTRREDLAERPMTQQTIARTVPVNRWVDINAWLLSIQRTAIRQLDLYLYSVPPGQAHSCRWEFAELAVEGVGETAAVFDTVIYARSALAAAPAGPAAPLQPALPVATDDGLRLQLSPAGTVAEIDGVAVGTATSAPTGLLVRDAATDQPPVAAGGTFTAGPNSARQDARLEALGLDLKAEIKGTGGTIDIRGTITDRRGQDRAVTVYFALPLSAGPWQWWDSVAAARAAQGRTEEYSNLETGLDYGTNGAHSKYPLGAVTLPGRAGLTLAVRMDEPVVHRIACNPGLGLFYIAADVALIPETAADGRALATAPFHVVLYRHDPAWGFRAALQRYYTLFPDFFTVRAPRQGGWYVWGDMAKTAGALEAGFAFHWGPLNHDAVRWDNANGPLALYYIEPETYQQTMEDFDRAPRVDEVLGRLRRLTDGDAAELAAVEALPYRVYPLSGKEAPPRERIRNTAQVVTRSLQLDADNQPYCTIGQFDWMQKSKWGAILGCNLAPDLPAGKGAFNLADILEPALAGATQAGVHYDGIGLDSFCGYGQSSRANYRREHFRSSRLPLCFSAAEQVPVQPAVWGSLEWVHDLAQAMHGRGLVLMANCSWGTTPAWLTFAAPYLDVFGAEHTQFADPEFIRAIAYRKPCTDLPYTPRPAWELPWHLLHGIFPGHGNDVAAMQRLTGPLQQLAQAGWEPLTLARVEPASLRVERFGTAPEVFLVLHNPAQEAVAATLSIDLPALALEGAGGTSVLTGNALAITAGTMSLTLGPQATEMVRLRRP